MNKQCGKCDVDDVPIKEGLCPACARDRHNEVSALFFLMVVQAAPASAAALRELWISAEQAVDYAHGQDKAFRKALQP